MIVAFANANKAVCAGIDRALNYQGDYAGYRTVLLEEIALFRSGRGFGKGDSPRTGTVPFAVLEAGGIDRPLLAKESGMSYHGLDIEYRERCDEIYDAFHVQSIEAPLPGSYHLIVSLTLLEHVRDNRAAIAAMYRALETGGAAMHYVPSKYHPYSLVLRLVGPRLQKVLIRYLRPEAQEVAGYPAYFHLCSPGEMKEAFEEQGFSAVTVRPFYRAADYFNFFVPFYLLVVLWENICERLGLEQLCSGFVITGRK